MEKDSRALNFDMERINIGTAFSLPDNFNENNERIIAMITYYAAESMYEGIADHHFYLRNGNAHALMDMVEIVVCGHTSMHMEM